MSQARMRAGVVLGILFAVAGGAAGGWLGGRASVVVPPAPVPPVFVNPLSDAAKGENLVLRGLDGVLNEFVVLEAGRESVLLSVQAWTKGSPGPVRQVRVSRNYFGFFYFLEGDVEREILASSARDFLVKSMTPDTITALGRPWACWRIEGTHVASGDITLWVTNEVPVHGVLRMESGRGGKFELESMGNGH